MIVAAVATNGDDERVLLGVGEHVLQTAEAIVVPANQPQSGIIGMPRKEVEGFESFLALHLRIKHRENMRDVDDGELVVVVRTPFIGDLAPRHPTAAARNASTSSGVRPPIV